MAELDAEVADHYSRTLLIDLLPFIGVHDIKYDAAALGTAIGLGDVERAQDAAKRVAIDVISTVVDAATAGIGTAVKNTPKLFAQGGSGVARRSAKQLTNLGGETDIGRGVRDVPQKALPSGPVRDALPSPGPTSRTPNQVRNARGGNKARGDALEEHIAEARRGTREVSETTQLGGRRHDVRTDTAATDFAIQGKNYLRYRTVRATKKVVKGEVPLTPAIRTQVQKDVLWVKNGRKVGRNRVVQWEFAGAPPSEALRALLTRHKITIYVW